MSFFSLLHDQKITPAPGKRVIPASELSLLLDGKKVIEKAEEDAHHFRQELEEEAKAIREKAQKEGFAAGLAQWTEKFTLFETDLAKMTKECRESMVPIAIQAAKKVVGKTLETDPKLLLDIIQQGLKAVRQHRTFRIWVNRKDLQLVDEHRNTLKEGLEMAESLTVQPRDDIQPGNAVIETEKGIINLDLEMLWKSLETAFNQLLTQSKS